MAHDNQNARPAGPSGGPALGAFSPRLAAQFDAGVLPTAVSPLEALMAQMQQLQTDAARQNHMSRVPPNCVARSLSRGRHANEAGEQQLDLPFSPKRRPPSPRKADGHRAVEDPKFRPKSQHPVLSGGRTDDEESRASSRSTFRDDYSEDDETEGYATSRAESPDRNPWPFELDSVAETASVRSSDQEDDDEDEEEEDPSTPVLEDRGDARLKASAGSQSPGLEPIPQKQSLGDNYWKSSTLAPPPIPPMSHLRRSGSPGILPAEVSDDDGHSSTAGSTFSRARQPSTSSGASAVHSPLVPGAAHALRSPSPPPSDRNAQHPRNFSRPLSRTSDGHLYSSANNSSQSVTGDSSSRQLHRDHRPPPLALVGRYHSEAEVRARPSPRPEEAQVRSRPPAASPSSLPRGRLPPRDSSLFAIADTSDGPTKPQEPKGKGKEAPERSKKPKQRAPSPMDGGPRKAVDAQIPLKGRQSRDDTDLALLQRSRLQAPQREGAKGRPVSSSQHRDGHTDFSRFGVKNGQAPTLKPRSKSLALGKAPPQSSVMRLTPEEHLDKGIEAHEAGSLSKSTYHLRLAAMQGNPTGMLLYALACRHGWGMRPNAKEGMKWLRKAVANVGTELNNPKKREEQAPQSIKEREAKKAKQAQFALAVYELGISHLNGWGTEQDRTLALRCFEISGEWGDVDALAEAGFCYAEGVGCRKNLKKAAKLYRMAEAKGMSMVGNSWIHKEKYLDEEEKAALAAQREAAGETPASKKARDKSHTRSFFGRKRSH